MDVIILFQCALEEEMHDCIARGEFQEAVDKSDKLAQREVYQCLY